MASDRKCALPWCTKRAFPSLDASKPHLTCGDLHHRLLMAARFHPNVSYPDHLQIFDRNETGRCALDSCSDPPHPGHSWCSRTHYLLWLSDFTSRLCPEQICKLPGCTRHVFVDDKLRSEYCGWRHCQEDVMRSAMQKHKRQEPPHEETFPSLPRLDESRRGPALLPVESLIFRLTDVSRKGVTPSNIEVDKDFFNKHPWELCIGGDTSWLIAQLKFTSKIKVVRTTKDGYHWKQQGRPQYKNGYSLKYFTYRKLKGNDANCSYYMEEYMADDVKKFALLRLHRGSVCRTKHSKECNQMSTEVQDEVAHSQNITSQSGDIWNCLSPLDYSSISVDFLGDEVSEENDLDQ